MCDTFVVLGNSTEDGSILFAKNSDRDSNEGHYIRFLPRQTHDPENESVQTTYLEIPQVEETHSVLLSLPYWIFGCEMGANEFGLVIGNEAVFTKEPERESNVLLGMDFIRLALERTKTATQALNLIIELLGKYGQGGNASQVTKTLYHNSYIIADPKEAWVLETADKFWIAEKVKDIRSISNTLTIETKYDKIHPELIKHALEKGYCKSRKDFNFARGFRSGLPDIRNWGGKGQKRSDFTKCKLQEKKGTINVSDMMNLLRNHNLKDFSKKEKWDPSKGSFNGICVHAKPIFVPGQTTASMVSQLRPDLHTHYLTGTSAPCTSLFKPVFIESGIPDIGPPPTDEYDEQSLWWLHEKGVHRQLLLDYPNRIRIIQPDIEFYETEWVKKIKKVYTELEDKSINERKILLRQLSQEAFDEAIELERRWIADIQKSPIRKKSGGIFYRRYWNKWNEKANLRL